MRRRHGDDDARLADVDAADAVVDRDAAQAVALGEPRGQLGHDLLGHALVGLVLEVQHVAVARAVARRADERRDRAGAVAAHLVHRGVERQRLLDEPERPPPETGGMSATSSPAASARSRSAYARFTANRMPAGSSPSSSARPHVADDARRPEARARRFPTRALAQRREQPHPHVHGGVYPPALALTLVARAADSVRWQRMATAEDRRLTDSGIEVKPVYTADDLPPGELELPGEHPFTRGPVPDDVPRPPVDDAPVRGLRLGGGDERALPLPARTRARRGSRSRSTSRRSSATTRTTRSRRARSAAPGSRSTRSRTWRCCSRGSRSARSRPR